MTTRESCPLCGSALSRSLAHGPAIGDTGNGSRPPYPEEERDCPDCGAQLIRFVGGPWQPAPQPGRGGA